MKLKGSEDLDTGEFKISEGIEGLMADKFIRITKAIRIQYESAIENDCVLKRSTKYQS